ncbi:hypothetical protein BKA93DRAFT_490555 [Sparassis latifolia]
MMCSQRRSSLLSPSRVTLISFPSLLFSRPNHELFFVRRSPLFDFHLHMGWPTGRLPRSAHRPLFILSLFVGACSVVRVSVTEHHMLTYRPRRTVLASHLSSRCPWGMFQLPGLHLSTRFLRRTSSPHTTCTLQNGKNRRRDLQELLNVEPNILQ